MSSSLRVFIIDMSELVKLYGALSVGEEPEIVVTDDSLRCGEMNWLHWVCFVGFCKLDGFPVISLYVVTVNLVLLYKGNCRAYRGQCFFFFGFKTI